MHKPLTRIGRDICLRIGGALLGAVAFGLARVLPDYVQPSTLPSAYLLAAATFLCASIGAALLFEGAGVTDKLVVSGRWAVYRDVAVEPSAKDSVPSGPRDRAA